MSDIREDISFMRTMAEQGRRGPILGGSFLMAAGVVYGFASFVQWGWATGAVPQGTATTLELWVGADLLFALLWLVLVWRQYRQWKGQGMARPGAAQSAFAAVWCGGGLGTCVLVGALAGAAWRHHDGLILIAAPAAAFAFYGSTWMILGFLAKRRWMFLTASASLMLTLILPMIPQAEMLLAMGIGLLLTLSLPGFMLMRDAAR